MTYENPLDQLVRLIAEKEQAIRDMPAEKKNWKDTEYSATNRALSDLRDRLDELVARDYKNIGFARLKAIGATRAEVGFSGGNDEGGVDGIKLYGADGQVSTLEQYVTPEGAMYDERNPDPLVIALCQPVDNEYGSFAGDFRVSGRVVWDVAAKTVTMKGEQSVESYDDFSRAF